MSQRGFAFVQITRVDKYAVQPRSGIRIEPLTFGNLVICTPSKNAKLAYTDVSDSL